MYNRTEEGWQQLIATTTAILLDWTRLESTGDEANRPTGTNADGCGSSGDS
jgi:hypothetical protein